MKNYKQHIFFIGLLLLVLVVFYFVGEIVLPFFIGLLLAYAVNPSVNKIQKKIPNRNLAVISFLGIITVGLVSLLLVFGASITNDFKRLNTAFETFINENSETIDESKNQIKSYIEEIYSVEELEKQLDELSQQDSLENLNTDAIGESFSKILSFFSSDEETIKTSSKKSINWLLIFLYSLGYFVYILFTYDYFDIRFKKYFGGEEKLNKSVNQLIQDFNSSFLVYFRQRSKVVLICSLIITVSFFSIGVPGALILGIIAGLLCYITNFHYFALIPLSLSCWALSIEQNHSFFLYFGIVVGIFILISILEEVWFFPLIMKGVSNMNPAIMMVSFTLWSYVFGTTTGLLIALPLTTILLLYLDRILIYAREYFST